MSIEQAIREYLSSNGIKQTFIAERCGWTKQRLNAILTGRQKISADDYGAICEAVGAPYDYFYNATADRTCGIAERAQDSAWNKKKGGGSI